MRQETLLTMQQAAEWIGVPEAVIRNETQDGRLPFVRRQRCSWIEPSDLRAYQARVQMKRETDIEA